MLGVGASKKVYADDLFNTRLWIGNGSNSATQTMTTGIDLVNNEGMVWVSNRDTANNDPKIIDTVRGQTGSAPSAPYYLLPQSSNDQSDRNWQWTDLTNGFSFNQDYGDINGNGEDMCAWSFRRQAGFFDIITYTGNDSSNRAISHSLGSSPGIILIKALNATKEWHVWHRDQHGKVGVLNTTAAFFSNSTRFPTIPTSTNFYVGNDSALNDGSTNYIAYLFAGGESTAATARSVDFDGSGNEALTIPYSSDINLSTGDWTIECWAKPDDTDDGGGVLLSTGGGNGTIGYESCMFWLSDLTIEWYVTQASGGAGSFIHTAAVGSLKKGQWSHIAATREGNTFRFFLDGTLTKEFTSSATLNAPQYPLHIGGRNGGSAYNGLVSNFRLVKGTAVYTSSFRPTYEPLTNITNTKILCCNNSSVTGSTVTSGTITSQGNATASTDSPFDDPAGFVFGEDSDQNVVKCGSYRGSGVAGMEVNVGFEPTWIMMKAATRVGDWYIMDSMRGVVSGGNDALLKANTADADGLADVIEFTATGFKVISTGTHWNNSSNTYSYVAIRRPDGYCGKPIEDATKCFAMDTGATSSTVPNFDSTFPVDFGMIKLTDGTQGWYTNSRLSGEAIVFTNSTDSQTTSSALKWDCNNGFWENIGNATDYQGWMWKRHAGFDVVAFEGTNVNNLQVPHGLNAVPEMIWIKNRDASENWGVYHKGLNNGTNPEQYVIRLNSDNPEFDHNEWWNDTAPTSTHFTVGIQGETNGSEKSMLAVLFSSVSGVSKVGHYSGTGSSNHSITTGFQPRFILIKPAHRADGYGGAWNIFDTLRGINSGNEYPLRLNTDESQTVNNHLDYLDLDSDGFTIVSTHQNYNYSGARYIYYAHA